MAHCVNRSSQEFKTLAEQSNLNPIILAAKVSLWQEANGLDNFPALGDIIVNTFNQVIDMPASKASSDTLEQVKEAAKKMGIKIQELSEYLKGHPSVRANGINGLADTIHGVVAIAQGRESSALTEEVVHVATAMLEQTNPKLITELISKIDRFKIYKQTFEAYKNNRNYQLPNGKPDIRKIKKEAIDKLISEVIINQSEGSTEFPELREEEIRNLVTRWWETILDFIRGLYKKSNIDIFKEAGEQVLSGESITISDIKSAGVFFQINESVQKQIDDLYNKYVEMNDRMELHPESVTSPRHYTFDGETVKQTVTDKIKKSKSVMKERTEAQKIDDEAKRSWGDQGHVFIENYITNNLIDKDGYKLSKFNSIPVTTKLSMAHQQQLGRFAINLIESYPEGTRFLVEHKVVNVKEKGMLGSTVDFKAIYPVTKKDGTEDMKVDTLDWKFTTVDLTREDDIPWYKQKDWVPQMGEYTKIDRELGVKPSQVGKARMIPFIMNYDTILKDNKKAGLKPVSIEIGKLDSLKETNLYLLPVPSAAESTGNEEIDDLVKSLRYYWEKLYKAPRGEKKFEKDIRLNQLGKAIRNLQVRLDFAPLYVVAKDFLVSGKTAIDALEKADYSKMDAAEIKSKLHELLEYQKSSDKFASMDQVFLSQYPKEGLTPENKKTLASLKYVTDQTKIMQDKILELMRVYTVHFALKEGVATTEEAVLSPEIPVSGFSKTWQEAAKLSPKLIKLVTKLNSDAGSLVNLKFTEHMSTFSKLLIDLENSAAAKGKKAFDMIATVSPTGLHLIKKLDKAFISEIEKAKENKDRLFFYKNVDIAKYNKLAQELIDENTKTINNTQFSSNEEENKSIKAYKISMLTDSVNLGHTSFNGYNSFYFQELFKQTLKEEEHYSPEFKQLKSSPEAFAVWEFFTQLNEKAKSIGYFEKRDSSFFPLIEATILQKLGTTSDFGSESMDIFKGLFTSKINENQAFSKIDPETGEPIKSIPKYFTTTDKTTQQLSTDLNKVGSLWIKALLDYEKATSLEDTFNVLLEVEKAKGSLLLNEKNEVIFDEHDKPKVSKDESKNAAILQVIAEDAIYNLGQDLGALGNIGISVLADKVKNTAEGKANFAVNTKKTLHNFDTYTRALAVGLKPLIALANWMGGQFQMFINSGGVYTWQQFEKNNAKVTFGNLSLLEKALLHTFVPLNDSVTEEESRKMAKKIGFTNYLSTWSFTDVMMSTNAFPERKLQFANALSFIENSMVHNGKIVNIRQFLSKEDSLVKYKMSKGERNTLEKTFEARVKALKDSSSLLSHAKIVNDKLEIEGVSQQEMARFRTIMVEYGRKLNGQMNVDNKAGYRRDAILSSFMMFKTWMPKLLGERITGLDRNAQLDQWEYGRVRLFFKTWQQLGLTNIFKMREILTGSEEGLKILDEMLENKRKDYFRKTGQILEITDEEFYDLVRRELSNEMKELGTLLTLSALLVAAGVANPPDDADAGTKNKYKLFLKAVQKVSDEVTFYYNPLSFESMTKGSVLPSLNLITKIERIFIQGFKEFGEEPEKAHFGKSVFAVVPGLSQLQTEIFPYLYPEEAKEWGIRVTGESRQ